MNLSNTTAERAVLGSCLVSKQALQDAISVLTENDFTDLSNGIAFKIITKLYSEDKPVDFVSFLDEAEKQGVFERIGGQPYLVSLVDNHSFIHGYYIDLLKDYTMRRELDMASTKIKDLARKGGDLPEILEQVERTVSDVIQAKKYSQVISVKDLSEEIYEEIKQGEQIDLSYKTYLLDSILGGLQPGSLNIIAARPSMGKTALALNIAQFGGTSDGEVLFFSLEMTAKQLIYRMLAAEGEDATLEQLKTGFLSSRQLDVLPELFERLNRRNVFIIDEPMLSAMSFKSQCKKFKASHPNLALIVVDYIQLMHTKKAENRQYEIAEISRAMKALALELQCPILALSQLSRETERRNDKKPQLSDLRDSGAIEQDADTVSLLYREDYYNADADSDESVVDVRIAKNRNGRVGNLKLNFHKNFCRFY